MLTSIKKIIIFVMLALFLVTLFSCDDGTKASFSLLNGEEKEGAYIMSVPSSTEKINLNDYLTVSDDAKVKIYSSSEMDEEIEPEVSLSTGENIFYIRVKEGTVKKDYTIKILRKGTITVTFDSNGGSACESIVVDQGTIITPPTTAKAGYDFGGWDFDFSLPITIDISTKAQWTPKTFSITVNGADKVDVKFGEDYSLISPQKEGYKFSKWIDANGKEVPAIGKWDRTESISVTPVFVIESYKISYVYNADISNKSSIYTIEDEVVLPIPVHPNGLEFEGWYSDSALKNKVSKIEKGSTGEKTFYAKWIQEIPQYSITIDADGFEMDGTVIDVKYGEAYTLPVAPDRAGYDFVAWMNGTDVFPTSGTWNKKENITVTIKWLPKQYFVSFVPNANVNVPSQTYTIETGLELPIPVHPNGLEFEGWYSDEECLNKVESIAVNEYGARVLYAKWKEEIVPEEEEYQITISALGYDIDGQVIDVKYGEVYTLPVMPVKPGYSSYWLLDGAKIAGSGTWNQKNDATITLAFDIIEYNVIYVFNASISTEMDKYTVENEFVLPVPEHPDGLEFEGWYSDSTLETKVSKIEKGSTGDKTFYGKWLPKVEKYEVVIDADGFDIDGKIVEVEYGKEYVLPEAPQRTGYEFIAWINGTTIVPTSGYWDVHEGATITIKWRPIAYSIEYVIDTKTENPNTTTEFTIESETITLLSPTRPNATFVGWYTDPTCSNESRIAEISSGTAKNVVLYAKFDITTYTLTYDANGGTVSKSEETYELNDSYMLLVPEYSGYSFAGWYNGETLVEDGVWGFESNIKLVAKWTKIKYLVEYDLAGGSTTETLKQSYSVTDSFTLPKPTREGYYFLGWKDTATNKVYYDTTIQKGSIGNKKFVAVWSEFSYSFSGENAIVTSYLYISSRARVKIPTTINYNGVDYSVTELGANIFNGIGKRLKNKEIIVDQKVMTKFDVEIPKTLKVIQQNAFNDCNNVCINVILDSGVDLATWADSLQVSDTGNDHVVDVIKGRRPAIGWSVYG